MCDESNGYTSSVWRSEDRTARKQYRCCACKETICVGDLYVYTFCVVGGDPTSMRHCVRCDKIVEALQFKHANERTGLTVDVELDCGTTWKDPPEHIAALAFVLPKDFKREHKVVSIK